MTPREAYREGFSGWGVHTFNEIQEEYPEWSVECVRAFMDGRADRIAGKRLRPWRILGLRSDLLWVVGLVLAAAGIWFFHTSEPERPWVLIEPPMVLSSDGQFRINLSVPFSEWDRGNRYISLEECLEDLRVSSLPLPVELAYLRSALDADMLRASKCVAATDPRLHS